LELRFTVQPPAGAFPVNFTVPVELPPPVTMMGDSPMEESAGGVTVRFAESETVPAVALTLATEVVATGVAGTLNVTEVAPAGTVAIAGGRTKLLLEARLTAKPPVGATAVSVTFPVTLLPPRIVVGLRVKLLRVCACARAGVSDRANAAAKRRVKRENIEDSFSIRIPPLYKPTPKKLPNYSQKSGLENYFQK